MHPPPENAQPQQPPITPDDIRNLSHTPAAGAKQHNDRYSEHQGADTSNVLQRAESQTSTLIESCSMTMSSLASPSPHPWSPLGHRPHETRYVLMHSLVQCLSSAACSEGRYAKMRNRVPMLQGIKSCEGRG